MPADLGSDPRRIRGVMAGGHESVFLSREGAEDREGAGADEGARLGANDLLVGISASSVTPFVRGALGAARARGARPCSSPAPRAAACRGWPTS